MEKSLPPQTPIVLPVQKKDKTNKVHKRQNLCTASQRVAIVEKVKETIENPS